MNPETEILRNTKQKACKTFSPNGVVKIPSRQRFCLIYYEMQWKVLSAPRHQTFLLRLLNCWSNERENWKPQFRISISWAFLRNVLWFEPFSFCSGFWETVMSFMNVWLRKVKTVYETNLNALNKLADPTLSIYFIVIEERTLCLLVNSKTLADAKPKVG